MSYHPELSASSIPIQDVSVSSPTDLESESSPFSQRSAHKAQRYGSIEGAESISSAELRPAKRTESHSRARRKALRKVHNHEPKRDTNAVALRLTNNGNVARDHLASERTFLAYVRTSLGMASAGVALMQFLRLGSSTKPMAAPIGGTMVGTSIIVLLLGTRRFFLVQKALVDGFYPTSLLDVIIISLILGCIIIAVFGILVWGGFQRV